MASEHEKLVESIALCCDCSLTEARAAVALIAERTKDVSPAMILAWGRGDHALADPDEAREDWQWMHAASALYPDGMEEKAK